MLILLLMLLLVLLMLFMSGVKSLRSNWQCVPDNPESDSPQVPPKICAISTTAGHVNLERNNFLISKCELAHQD